MLPWYKMPDLGNTFSNFVFTMQELAKQRESVLFCLCFIGGLFEFKTFFHIFLRKKSDNIADCIHSGIK
jgi:hypothetical protein